MELLLTNNACNILEKNGRSDFVNKCLLWAKKDEKE